MLGTPQARTSADNFSTADMVAYQSTVASWIREAAHPENVQISSGHAMPRPAAHHLALSYHQKQRDWTLDTEAELVEVLQLFHRDLDLISVHIYPGPPSCAIDPSLPTCDNYRFGKSPSYLLSVAARAAAASGKTVYLGEFGLSLPDRRNSSSLIYNFTEQMLESAKSVGVSLATYWTWEDANQAGSYGIFPANETGTNDAQTIQMLQKVSGIQYGSDGGDWTAGPYSFEDKGRATGKQQCRWAHGSVDPQTGDVATYTEYATDCGHNGQDLGHISSLVNPAVSLLYALTGDQTYATEIHDALTTFAAPYLHNITVTDAFHCYETINAYRVMVSAHSHSLLNQWFLIFQ